MNSMIVNHYLRPNYLTTIKEFVAQSKNCWNTNTIQAYSRRGRGCSALALNHDYPTTSIYKLGPLDDGRSLKGPPYVVQKAIVGITRGRHPYLSLQAKMVHT